MSADRILGSFAILAVLCVLVVFFFPAMQGPYCVVHGPVTALLSIRAAAILRWRIVRAGLKTLGDRLHDAFAALTLVALGMVSAVDNPLDSLVAECTCLLRC
jgi:hypothetical protein